MTQHTYKLRSLSALLAASALAACGGGGNDALSSGPGTPSSSISASIQAPGSAINNAGTTVEVMGAAKSSNSIIKTMTWSVSPAAALSNADCAASIRDSQVYTSNPAGATGAANWSCAVGLKAPAEMSATTDYTLTLTTTDDKGNTRSASQKVTFTPAPATGAPNNGFAVNAGNGFNAVPGSVNALHCDAAGGKAPYSYSWVISDNAGYNFSLSSYAAQDSLFTAPAVSGPTTLRFACRATDANNITAVSTVSATITPPAGAPNSNSLVANVAQPGVATPGQMINLNGGSSGWFGPNGAAVEGPLAAYEWTSSDPRVVIANPTAKITNVVFPSDYSEATTVAFTLKATSGSASSSSTVNVLVDPFGPLSLTLNPSATATEGNKAVAIAAVARSSSGSPQLYYRWTQVSGPAVALGGADTSTLGVVPPAAGSNTVYVFRVAVGYAPITTAYPGLYFSDATVTVTPVAP